MEKETSPLNLHFEYLLWKNELEFNRRELAIFESYLLNREKRINPCQLTNLMSQLHDYMRSVNKLLTEIASDSTDKVLPLEVDKKVPEHVIRKRECSYIREEMFYFEQNYRRFKNTFCSFAAGLEAA